MNLSLATDPSQLTTALQTFVSSYNALASQVTQETGTGAGALGGNSVIRDISTDLGQLSGYFGSSSTVRSLSDLGITFDNSGQMTLDSSVVSRLLQHTNVRRIQVLRLFQCRLRCVR